MNTCTLKILDQVNVKFDGLDPIIRRKITEKLSFFCPYARHVPSFKMGRWDGKVNFATIGGGTYVNLLEYVLPIVLEHGYEIELDDRRPQLNFSFPEVSETMLSHKLWPEGHRFAGEPIVLRDYQVEAIRRYLDNLQSIQSISTGAGKTLLTAALSTICEPYGRTLVIVPSKSLVEQTEEDYKNLGLDVGVFYGDRKEWGHTHTISTWQSLSVFDKKTRRKQIDIPIDEFVAGMVCVMVDEVHTAKAKELKDLLTNALSDVPIRWGLTGTVPKDDFDFFNILLSLGPVVGEIKAHDLQDQGVLAKCDVNVMQLVDDHVSYSDYAGEYKFLTTDKARLSFIAESCIAISETGNTLILVDRIETGEFLKSIIPDSIFINGTVKTKNRKKEYDDVQTADGKILIATYGVAAVGINIPRIFNLVLMESGKSFVRVIQSIGRGIRKAKDKDFVRIYDICSTSKFSKRHLAKRKTYYKDANYPYKVSKVIYR